MNTQQRLDSLDERVTAIEEFLAIGPPDSDPEPEPDPGAPVIPSSITMMNGEKLYITGHAHTIYAVQSGEWKDPNTWNTGSVPNRTDAVAVTDGRTVTLAGECQCRALVVKGAHIVVADGAKFTMSTVTGFGGATWDAGTAEQPIGYRLTHFASEFEEGDTAQVGNGFIWCGHGTFRQYGYEVPEQPHHEWYSSNGQRFDSRYTVGRPDEFKVGFNLDSNSNQWDRAGDGIRPHAMLMHGSGVGTYTTQRGWGRTDKSRVLGDDNKVGRYAFHCHRGGEEQATTLDHWYAVDSVGWLIVNHSSHLIARHCAAGDTFGSAFCCEAADEVGSWEDCQACGLHGEGSMFNIERRRANDRWFAGCAIVGAPRHRVVRCTAADCNFGVSYFNTPLPEVIGGLPSSGRYDDGVDTRVADQEDTVECRVYGFAHTGLWSYRTATRGPRPLARDCVLVSEVPGSRGILYGYNAGWIIRDTTIECDIGVSEENLGGDAEAVFERCSFRVRVANESKPGASMHTTRFEDCDIESSEVGIVCRASYHRNANRIYVIDRTQITAPVPVTLVSDGPPFDQYLGESQKNEVWVEGERLLYPWQE